MVVYMDPLGLLRPTNPKLNVNSKIPYKDHQCSNLNFSTGHPMSWGLLFQGLHVTGRVQVFGYSDYGFQGFCCLLHFTRRVKHKLKSPGTQLMSP